MSRLPRCFYVGFRGLGHSHEPVLVSKSLPKFFLLAFPLVFIDAGLLSRSKSYVFSLPRQSTHYPMMLLAVLCHLDIPVTPPEHIKRSRDWWSEPRGPWGLFAAAKVETAASLCGQDELIPGSPWRALRCLPKIRSQGTPLSPAAHLPPRLKVFWTHLL